MTATVWGDSMPASGVSRILIYTVTATVGQTGIPIIGFTYTTGTNAIAVFVNGFLMTLTSDYTESSVSAVTFTYGLQAGDQVIIVKY